MKVKHTKKQKKATAAPRTCGDIFDAYPGAPGPVPRIQSRGGPVWTPPLPEGEPFVPGPVPAGNPPALNWIMDNMTALEKKYPEKWVIASKDGLEGHGKSLPDLFKAAAKRRPEINKEDFVAVYIRRKPDLNTKGRTP